MAETVKERKGIRFPLYVTKKIGLPKWRYWLIRCFGVIFAFLLAGIVCTIIRPGTFGIFFAEMFRGCIDFGDFSTFVDLMVTFSLLLLISLALIPCFKMRFWNIGAEGQILAGCLASAAFIKFMPKGTSDFSLIMICAVTSILAGIVWTVVPAIFKALFNTNETLFTLMMNYIMILIVKMCIDLWDKSHGIYGGVSRGAFPEIFDHSGTLTILIAAIIFVFMFFYIKKSIHGYELSVVGESVNTARYVGINVKKVILRTSILTGALMGFIGFLVVCSISLDFNADIVEGKGFTGILIAWLGHFEPGEVALFSFLAAVMERGTATAASNRDINISSQESFSSICIGVFFFVVIACEFVSNYQIKRHHDKEFDEFYALYNQTKRDTISAKKNKFVRFWAWVWYYMSYPFVWLAQNHKFKIERREKKEGEKA